MKPASMELEASWWIPPAAMIAAYSSRKRDRRWVPLCFRQASNPAATPISSIAHVEGSDVHRDRQSCGASWLASLGRLGCLSVIYYFPANPQSAQQSCLLYTS